ncbi:hypothetical protein DVK02_13060 [Halobellus sp. Atlit-31R]|nr:hypothetical protein DVK02_13060 [Halobellus sp. Atlit-31R]
MDGSDQAEEDTDTALLRDTRVAEKVGFFVCSATDIFTHIRPDGSMAYVTDTEEMLGRPRREFVESSLSEFIHPQHKERVRECFDSALTGGGRAQSSFSFDTVVATGSGLRAARLQFHRSQTSEGL